MCPNSLNLCNSNGRRNFGSRAAIVDPNISRINTFWKAMAWPNRSAQLSGQLNHPEVAAGKLVEG
jgi:hypothetical protein